MISFAKDILSDPAAATSREWLETNGLGGFSSSTIIGLNTRRYHGLLTAATRPPVGRVVMLSKLEETLILDGRRFELSANQYPGVVHPRGFEYQTGFRLDPFPIFTYEIQGLVLEKSVFMVQSQNTTVVHYELNQAAKQASVKLELRPLIAFRDYHSTTHENGALNQHVAVEDGTTTVKPYHDLPALHFAHDFCDRDTNAFWYRNFEYILERERGLDFVEDLFSPFALTFDLNRYSRARVISSTERQNIQNADHFRVAEIKRRQEMMPGRSTSELISSLNSAADQFIVARDRCRTVIAGYHWFSDWGRDTMIALPGLMLATGRYEIAKRVLLEFARHVDRGMLPNRFPDAGETPEFNTVDATLWFFEAVRALVQYTGDYDFVRKHLYEVLSDIISWHVKGTRYGIRVDNDGLLEAGEPGVQLTWMDAKVGDRVITPRIGKPVEIQALWYNALRVMQDLAAHYNDAMSERNYRQMANRTRQNFNKLFWNEQASCLYDVVNGAERDPSIRPNQVFAVSLKNSMTSKERARAILRVVERELLTPRGLRTLSPADPHYHGRYEGDGPTRDSVYHQGTVWPWLMGPYISAYMKIFGEKAARVFAIEWLANFEGHLREACLGQVSEIFDGDAPHAPRGCAAQAWSVAEILRAAVENIYHTEPFSSAAAN